MPVIIPKPRKPTAEPPAAPGITRAEVEAMLAQRDAMWSQHLAAATQALRDQIAAMKPAPRTGSTIVLTRDRGEITGAVVKPQGPQ